MGPVALLSNQALHFKERPPGRNTREISENINGHSRKAPRRQAEVEVHARSLQYECLFKYIYPQNTRVAHTGFRV